MTAEAHSISLNNHLSSQLRPWQTERTHRVEPLLQQAFSGRLTRDSRNFAQEQAHARDCAGLVVDGQTGQLLRDGFAVGDKTGGWKGGGARTHAASAMATQAGGSCNIMASEHVCGSTEHPVPGGATLKIFDRATEPREVPVVVAAISDDIARLLEVICLNLSDKRVKMAMELLKRGGNEVALRLIEDVQTQSGESTKIRLASGVALIADEKYADAIPILEEVTSRDLSLAVASNSLGFALRKLANFRRFGSSLPTRYRAFRIKPGRTNLVEYGYALHELAVVLLDQAQYREAEALFCRALALFEILRDSNDQSTAALLNNLAKVYKIQVG